MRDLPSGTVTFLFTDIEGSTRLLHELGDGYSGALAEHRRILRAVFANRGGAEVDTQGDAFFYAFARASDAVASAGEAQEALSDGPIHVRMGVHTGEPLLTDEGYIGLDVHTAARIAGCAHGGQVVISRRTRELCDDPRMLTDLGDHRLKDLVEPMRLFQLGATEFPSLKTLNATNLPEPVSSFVGRLRELDDASDLLSSSRLLTVTGPGGTGKTRFAIALARAALDDYPDGVWWVPLAALRDPRLVLASAERAVGATADLAAHVSGKRMLIVFDNLEHVIAAAPDLAAVLGHCPNLTLLVTSRELLRVGGEREWALGPLSDDEGTALFSERAQMQPTDAIRDLCRRLDGLPLAIELAAARANLLTPEQILQRLSQRLDLFKGGRDADPRHTTLRATIEWSHELLTPREQAVFARCSVFAGGATVDAVEVVAAADPDLIQSLLDKSLIRRTEGRLWMLETVREYAVERLQESGEASAVSDRHARFFLAVAEATNLSDSSQGEAQHDIALAEQDNFRVALEWAVAGGDIELGLRMAAALEYWVVTIPFEAMPWFDALLSQSAEVSASVRAAALRAYGGTVNPTGDDAFAEQLYEQSLAEYRRVGDDAGVAGALARLGHSAWYRGDNEAAFSLGREGLEGSRRAGNKRSGAQALGLLGELEFERGAHDVGLDLLQQSADTAAECGFQWWQARMLLRLAKRARQIGRDGEAVSWACDSLRLATGISDRRRIVQLLDLLSAVAADEGDRVRAGRLQGAVAAQQERGPLSAWTPTELPDAIAGSDFDRARQDGVLLSLDAAVDYALLVRQRDS